MPTKVLLWDLLIRAICDYGFSAVRIKNFWNSGYNLSYYSSTNIEKSGLKSCVLNKHLNPVIHRVFNRSVNVKKRS